MTNNDWQVINYYLAGHTLVETSSLFGLTPSAVHRLVTQTVDKNVIERSRKLHKEAHIRNLRRKYAAVIRSWLRGRSIPEVQAEFEYYNVKHIISVCTTPEEKASRSNTWSAADFAKPRQWYIAGIPVTKIAERLGVSRQFVYYLIRRHCTAADRIRRTAAINARREWISRRVTKSDQHK